jgi:multiple sugar transport system substrate-binding protein
MTNKIGIAFIILCLGFALAACSGGGQDAAGKTAEDNEPVELVFYFPGSNGVTQEEFMNDIGNSIQKKFPSFKLTNITKQNDDTLPQLIAAGQTIDIAISSNIKALQFMFPVHVQSDISELIRKNRYDLSRLEPSTVEAQRQIANGGIYGLPVSTSTVALFYNKDLFDKFGVPYPRDGMTWDELYALAQKMTRIEGDRQYKGIAINFLKMLDVDQLSSPVIDPKTNEVLITRDRFARAFGNLVRFFQIPGNELPGQNYVQGAQVRSFLNDQTAAMLLNGNGFVSELQDRLNWDVVQIPFYEDMIGVGPQSEAVYYFITSLSRNRDAAFRVLEYVTSEEYQREKVRNGKFSILKDAGKFMSEFGADMPYLKGKNIKGLVPEKYAAPTPLTVHDAVARDMLKQAVGDVAHKRKDLNTALKETAEQIAQEIAAQGGKEARN